MASIVSFPSPETQSSHLPSFSYAFQPIVDIATERAISYEALIRGPQGEAAYQVFNNVPQDKLHHFDSISRITAIEVAADLNLDCDLNLNFLPRSLLLSNEAIEMTIAAAQLYGFPLERIVIEVTESEIIEDQRRFASIMNDYRGSGLKVAIDDFGAGYSGLNFLANFQPDQIKIDMLLLRDIEKSGPRQAIVRAICSACLDLGIDIIAEGVETLAEFHWLQSQGIQFFQGYLFAKPGFETLPLPEFPKR